MGRAICSGSGLDASARAAIRGGMHDYLTVPFQGAGRGANGAGTETAAQLRSLILRAQGDGWEFLHVAHTTHYEKPGCLAALFGASAVLRQIDIVVFRRPLAPGQQPQATPGPR